MAKRGWLGLIIILLLAVGGIVIYLATFERRTYNIASHNPELFGVGEPITLRHVRENLDLQRSFETLRSLGVKRLREWTWMGALLTSQTTLNPIFEETLNLVISEMGACNITIMGMSHDFPSWMTGIDNDPQAVPHRNTTAGSDYMRFLERYRESWKTLAAAFPKL